MKIKSEQQGSSLSYMRRAAFQIWSEWPLHVYEMLYNISQIYYLLQRMIHVREN